MLTYKVNKPGLVQISADNRNLYDRGGYEAALVESAAINHDELGQHLRTFENYRGQLLDLHGLCGHGEVQEPPVGDLMFYGAPPNSDPFLPRRDGHLWSEFLDHFYHFWTDWNFVDPNQDLVLRRRRRENFVSHLNLFGTVEAGTSPSSYYRKRAGLYESPEAARFGFTLCDPITTGRVADIDDVTPFYTPSGSLDLRVEEIRKGLGEWTRLDILGIPGYNRSYSNLRFNLRGQMVHQLMYLLNYQAIWPWWDMSTAKMYRAVFAVLHTYEFTSNVVYLDYGDHAALHGRCDYQVHVDYYKVDWCSWVPGQPAPPFEGSLPSMFRESNNPSNYRWYDHDSYVEWPYFSAPDTGVSEFPVFVGSTDGRVYESGAGSARTFPSFCVSAAAVLPDCYSAAFISSKNAIDAHLEVLGTNHLETLAEVRDLCGLVEVLKLLRQFKDLRRGGILHLLSLLADAKIAYSFAISPSVSDAKEIAGRSRDLISKFRSGEFLTGTDIRGKHSIDIPATLTGNFDGMSVVVRSKLGVRIHPDSFLSAALPIRSVGLLPSFSALWDILPWSWLVDWFTHLGEYLDDVDSQAMFLGLEITKSVHSVCIEYKFNHIDMEDFKFHVDEDGPDGGAGYRLYDRYVMSTLPSMGPSRLPLHGSILDPDWGLVGSLVYKFLHK
jgi:hypothetical protein